MIGQIMCRLSFKRHSLFQSIPWAEQTTKIKHTLLLRLKVKDTTHKNTINECALRLMVYIMNFLDFSGTYLCGII